MAAGGAEGRGGRKLRRALKSDSQHPAVDGVAPALDGAGRAFGILGHELKSLLARVNSDAEAAITVARMAVPDALGPGPEFDKVDATIRDHLSRMCRSQRAVSDALRLAPLMAAKGTGAIGLQFEPLHLRWVLDEAIVRSREDTEGKRPSPGFAVPAARQARATAPRRPAARGETLTASGPESALAAR